MAIKRTTRSDAGVSTGAAPARRSILRRGARSAAPVEAMPATALQPTPSQTVTHDDIARLAYSYWEARGRQNGSPEEDWVRAERELKVTAALV